MEKKFVDTNGLVFPPIPTYDPETQTWVARRNTALDANIRADG